MSMKANILRDSQGNITVQMEGGFNYESTQRVRERLEELFVENPHADINFDLGGIDFVGSSGICHFVETLKMLGQRSTYQRIGLSNVKPEFRKVFKLYSLDQTAVHINDFEMNNDETLELNTLFGNRKNTFEN